MSAKRKHPCPAVKIAAICSLTALEIANLLTIGVDGTLFSLVVACISGLAGYEFGRRR